MIDVKTLREKRLKPILQKDVKTCEGEQTKIPPREQLVETATLKENRWKTRYGEKR